jgi:hypothetical protein
MQGIARAALPLPLVVFNPPVPESAKIVPPTRGKSKSLEKRRLDSVDPKVREAGFDRLAHRLVV